MSSCTSEPTVVNVSQKGQATIPKRLDEVFAGTADGFLCETNASEVYYLVARFEGRDDEPTDDSLEARTETCER